MPLNLLARGKVREVYEVDQDRLLLVASDRISAFDVVMNEAIPHKGAVLTQISSFWFAQLDGVCAHHMISADIDQIIDLVPSLAAHRAGLTGRSMLCRRTKVFPIECVLRGYLSGSAWGEYRKTGTLAGEALAPGLVESAKLEPAIFSPATKAESGHDENITTSRMAEIVGAPIAKQLEALTRAIYGRGLSLALAKGIIIADTKFEFGQTPDGQILLIDEVMTPDSSRFWPADLYRPGGPQPSFDKQPVRDYLAGLRDQGKWSGDAPPPPLPESVVKATSLRYLDVYERLTGAALKI
jgi:phosphoribosylaminoimidazole-succinocarboxamide synthase